ncbi:NUDIX hydrolase [Nocardioides gilvus]|uniref:NUDIX hydrolase n=1 Tax=Nocardioides gilvus TaxID=1735589 RepID=UPI001EF7193B|nr:NUDIX hydrolase [Nocardioides gilvus]
MTLPPSLTTTRPGVARVWWPADIAHEGFREATAHVATLVARGLHDHGRVEALVDPEDEVAQRIATWAGLQREGLMRGGHVEDGHHHDRIMYARLATDPPISEPGGFRALLNSFLPRKRAIGQMLVRDPDDRVLMCELTYKPDWDLPGGVVEVGESPRTGVTREIQEELQLDLPAGRLLVADWLPAWSGWDDAVCFVFDGGVHDASLLQRIVREEREIRAMRFCTMQEVRDNTADFTARRVAAALEAVASGACFTESGHRRPEVDRSLDAPLPQP